MHESFPPPRLLTRRALLKASTAGLVAAGLWPGRLLADGDGHPADFHFLVVNDTHYLDHRCGPWLERAMRQMKAHEPRPAFCLLAGDLSEKGTAEQLDAMRALIKELGIETYVVPGNHDHDTKTARKPYDERFPGRANYRFSHDGWQFIALDTTQGQGASNTLVQPEAFRWLEDNLGKLDPKRPTVVFTHFPLGPLVPSRPKNADKVLTPLRAFNMQAVFCGHFHGFTERILGPTVLTTNKCCSFSRQNHDGTKEKGYFLCHARDGKITRTFVEVKPA